MSAPSKNIARSGPAQPEHAQVWLLGQPPLSAYLKFVEETSIGGAAVPRSALVDEWRVANDYYGELETSEAGYVEQGQTSSLDASLSPLVEQVMADARYRRTFDALPTRFAMVELDRLIVGHPYVSEHHTERLQARLAGRMPTAEELFRFCLPLDRAEAPVKVRKSGPRRYQFWSESTDFRFQEAKLLKPDQLNGFEPYGALGGVVGLMVGFGSNFLNCIEADDRLLLHNGHHRAYALRALGVTHAPCIIQSVTRLDELKISAARAVLEDPGFYFRAKRPPLLKDFFDPRIRKVLRVPRIVAVVEVSFETSEYKVRDFDDAE